MAPRIGGRMIFAEAAVMGFVTCRRRRRAAAFFFRVACAISAMCMLSTPMAEASGVEPGLHRTQTGLASYYGRALDGRKTASGERFDSDEMTAAHPVYPLGSRVRVTNLKNQRSVVVRITDRGPTTPNRREGVIIDLSRAAATRLDMREDGRARVRVQVLEWGRNGEETQASPASG